MAIYALGYATKKGMEIESDHGYKGHIPPRKVGNMFWPDAMAMARFIEETLASGDTLISPSGPNSSYLTGVFRRGATVHWINPARLADLGATSKFSAKVLLNLWQSRPEVFYTYIESDFQVAQLRRVYSDWVCTETEAVALGNSMDQALRRELEVFRFIKPDQKEWVEWRLKNALTLLRRDAKDGGITLPKELQQEYRSQVTVELERIYQMCLNGDTKQVEQAQKELKKMKMSSVLELLDEHERAVKETLKGMPHNHFFGDLKGVGPKSMAGTLVAIGNPLLYPNFGHLNSYLGMKVINGQGIRRGAPENPEDLRFNHHGHRVFCFDFGDKAHYHEGFFQDLYQAYKCHQFLTYWPLVELTQEIFKFWGVVDDSEEAEAEDTHGVALVGEAEREISPTQVMDWVERLNKMGDLPITQRNPRIKSMLAELNERPTMQGIRRLFSKAPGSGNLQMPLKRLDTQAKRHNGITLARITYYRWREYLGFPAPLTEDFIYAQQCRSIHTTTGMVVYDSTVTLEYYQEQVTKMQDAGQTLPEEAWIGKDGKGDEKERFPGLRL